MQPTASSTKAGVAAFWSIGGGLLALFLTVRGESDLGASSPHLLGHNGDFVEANRIAIDDTGKEIGKGKGSFHIGGVEGKVIPGDKRGFDLPRVEGNMKDEEGQRGGQGGNEGQRSTGTGGGERGGDRVDQKGDRGQAGDGKHKNGGSVSHGAGKGDKESEFGGKTGGGTVEDGTGGAGNKGDRVVDLNKGGNGETVGMRVPAGGGVSVEGGRVPAGGQSVGGGGGRTERDGGRGAGGGGGGGGGIKGLGNTIVIPGTDGNIVLTEGGVLAGGNLPTEGKNILESILPDIGKKPEGCIVFGDVKPGNLTCYSCKVDFRKTGYDRNNPCLGRHGNQVDKKYLVRCGSEDIYCRVERNEVNGIMIQLTRECTDICYYGCRPKGFGINNEACSKCCNTDGCNHVYPESSAPNLPSRTPGIVFLLLIVLLDSWRRL